MKDIKKRFISLKGFITRRRKSKSPDVMQQNPRNIEEVNENEEEKLQKADVQMEIVNSNHVQNKVLNSCAKSNHQPNRDSIDSTYLFENLVLSNDESDKEISADRYYKNQDVTGSINKINLSLENSVDISNSNKNQFKFQERNKANQILRESKRRKDLEEEKININDKNLQNKEDEIEEEKAEVNLTGLNVEIKNKIVLKQNIDGSICVFWIDAHEEICNKSQIILFGKVKEYQSICLIVRNIERIIYVIPKENCEVKDAQNEIQNILDKIKVKYTSKIVTK